MHQFPESKSSRAGDELHESAESLRDSSFSAGTEQPLLQAIPWSQSRAREGSSPCQPQRRKSPRKQATIPYFSSIPAAEHDFFLEEPSRGRAGAPQPGVSVKGGRDTGASSTTQQANNRERKWDLGPAECRGCQSLPGAVLVPGWSPGVTPRKVCPGTASSAQSRGKEQPPHPSAPAHGQCSVHPAGTQGHPHVPAAGVSQGSAIHTSDFS